MIPLTKVQLPAEVEPLVLGVLRSGQLAQGELVATLEREFAALHDVAHAIAVNNGTTALIAALEVLDLQPGDEVITSPFTFVATLNAILQAGATARFADIGDDFNVVPDAVSGLVGERTRALLPVDLYGYPCDLDALAGIATAHGLPIVEDAAQAVGAICGSRHVGGFGIGCFSMYATKNLATGEGGMITTDDDALADRLRVLRNQGMRQRYQYEMAGNNYRLTDLAAAVGLPQLRELPATNERRQANAAKLSANLRGVDGLVVPPDPSPGRTHVFHQYTVRITDDAPVSRDEFVERVVGRGVGCGVYYPRAVFDYDCYRDHQRVVVDDVPAAHRAAREVASLPVHQFLTDGELDEISSVVTAVLRG